MSSLSLKLVGAFLLYSVFSALFFGYATALSSRESPISEDRDTPDTAARLVYVAAFVASILPFVFIPFFAFRYSIGGAAVLFALGVATVGLQRGLALFLADRIESIGFMAFVGLLGMIWCVSWVIDALP